MSLSRILFVLLGFVAFLSSCRKEDHPQTGNKMLYRVASDNDSLISATFFYDAQNRLTKVVDSIRYGHQWETSIVYNSSGNPLKLTILYRSPSNIVDFAVIDSIVYDNGRAVRMFQDWPYSPHAGSFMLTNRFVNDAQGKLVRIYGGQTTDLEGPSWFKNLTYDANENIIKLEDRFYQAGMISNTITYNSELNPYHNIGLILFYVKGDNLFLGKHNKTKVVRHVPNEEPLTINYAYQYDTDGLLKKMIINRSQNGTTDSTSNFDFYYR